MRAELRAAQSQTQLSPLGTDQRAHRAGSGCKAVRSWQLAIVAKSSGFGIAGGVAGTLAVAQPPSAFQDKSSQPARRSVRPTCRTWASISGSISSCRWICSSRTRPGKTVKLGDYFQSGRPVILNLVYYTCPMLCGEELAGEASALGVLEVHARARNTKSFRSASIPTRRRKDAAEKKQVYIARMNEHLEHKTDGAGWHFLTGQQPEIKQLADAVGFRYRRDPRTGQFIHATAIMIVTPPGKIAQYYYGVEFSPKDIRLGLIEASQDKIGNVGGPGVAVLLPLRPEDRPIRRGGHQYHARGGSCHHADSRRIHLRHVPPRVSPNRQQGNRTGLIDMWKNFPLFPERASALAWQVDGLYFLLIGGVGIFHAADFRADLLLRDQVSPLGPSSCGAD